MFAEPALGIVDFIDVVDLDVELGVEDDVAIAAALAGFSLNAVGAAILGGNDFDSDFSTFAVLVAQLVFFVAAVVVEQRPGEGFEDAGFARTVFAADGVDAGLEGELAIAMDLEVPQGNGEDLHESNKSATLVQMYFIEMSAWVVQ